MTTRNIPEKEKISNYIQRKISRGGFEHARIVDLAADMLKKIELEQSKLNVPKSFFWKAIL